MNALAGNMNRHSAAVNGFGIAPWAKQVAKIRIILEKNIEEGT